MTKVKARVGGHYEVRDLAYGKDYRWVPAHAIVECGCGRVMDVDAHHAVCPGCGADHGAVISEISAQHPSEETLRPWRPAYEAWARSRESHTENQEWLEQRSLE